jgi:transcriptional regulator with XRE-family HTH domain
MKLGYVLKRYRVISELSLRDLASEIGVGAATLMRLEQGRVPDGETLAKILIWLLIKEKQNVEC